VSKKVAWGDGGCAADGGTTMTVPFTVPARTGGGDDDEGRIVLVCVEDVADVGKVSVVRVTAEGGEEGDGACGCPAAVRSDPPPPIELQPLIFEALAAASTADAKASSPLGEAVSAVSGVEDGGWLLGLPAFMASVRLDFLYDTLGIGVSGNQTVPSASSDPRCASFVMPEEGGMYAVAASDEVAGKPTLSLRTSPHREWCAAVARDVPSVRCDRPLSLSVPPSTTVVNVSAEAPPTCGAGKTPMDVDGARFIVGSTFLDPVAIRICPAAGQGDDDDDDDDDDDVAPLDVEVRGQDPLCGCVPLTVRAVDDGCVVTSVVALTPVLITVLARNTTTPTPVVVTATSANCADECVYHPLTVKDYPELTCTSRYLARLRKDLSHKPGACGALVESHVAELVYFDAPATGDFTFSSCSSGYVDRTRMLITDVACSCVGAAEDTSCALPRLGDIFSGPVRGEVDAARGRWLADALWPDEGEGEGEEEEEEEDDDEAGSVWPENVCAAPVHCATSTVHLEAGETVVIRLTASREPKTSVERQIALRVTSEACEEACAEEGVWCDSLSRQGWTDIVDGQPAPYVAAATTLGLPPPLGLLLLPLLLTLSFL
jgi:hypothetical protein